MALVEGVLMRGTRAWAAACRRPDGTIAVRTGRVSGWSLRWDAVPLARGIAALAEALTLGIRGVLWSDALHAPAGRVRHDPGADVSRARLAAALVPGLAVTIALVFVVPAAGAHAVAGGSPAAAAVAEAALRVAVLIGYLVLVGRSRMIRRVFAYHGAEHKAVAAHEAGGPLTIAAARRQSTRHGRCGTTFLAVVVAVTTTLHVAAAPFYSAPIALQLAVRVAMVPVVAALAYEVLTAVNRSSGRLARAVLAAGMGLQRLTVAEPDDDQLEVALVALRAVVERDAGTRAGELVAA